MVLTASQIRLKLLCPIFQIVGYVYHNTHGQRNGKTLKNQWCLWKGISTGILLQVCDEQHKSRRFLLQNGCEKAPTWQCLFVHRQQKRFLSVYVDDIKMAEKTKIWSRCEKGLMKQVDLEKSISFLERVYLGCIQRECEPNDSIVDVYRKMFGSRFSAKSSRKVLKGSRMGESTNLGMSVRSPPAKNVLIRVRARH